MRTLVGRAAAVVLVAVGLTGPGATGAHAAPADEACAGVAVVVDLGDLPVAADGRGSSVRCATTTGRALDVLTAAGVRLEGTAELGLGFVCRVDGRPAPDEPVELPDGSSRTETCRRTPPASAYWSLWTVGDDGGWRYATTGVGDTRLAEGDAFGLVYAVGRAEGRAPAVTPAAARAGSLPDGWARLAPDAAAGVPAVPEGGRAGGPDATVVAGAALLLVLVAGAAALRVRRARR